MQLLVACKGINFCLLTLCAGRAHFVVHDWFGNLSIRPISIPCAGTTLCAFLTPATFWHRSSTPRLGDAVDGRSCAPIPARMRAHILLGDCPRGGLWQLENNDCFFDGFRGLCHFGSSYRSPGSHCCIRQITRRPSGFFGLRRAAVTLPLLQAIQLPAPLRSPLRLAFSISSG